MQSVVKSSFEMNKLPGFLFLTFSSLLVLSTAKILSCSYDENGSNRFPSSIDCKWYHECDMNSVVYVKKCPSGTLFDSRTSNCRPEETVQCDNNRKIVKRGYNSNYQNQPYYSSSYNNQPNYNPNQPNQNSECPQKYRVDPSNRSKYFECLSGGFWFENTCSQGSVFDENTKRCEYEYNNNQNDCPKKLEKSYFDNTKYMECVKGGYWIEKQCSPGMVFNEAILACELQGASNYHNTCPSKFKANPADNKKYFECLGGTWFEMPCGNAETFNPTSNKCEATGGYDNYDSSCPVKYQKSPLDRIKYYECVGGTWYERMCAHEMSFNEQTKKCEWSGGMGNSQHVCLTKYKKNPANPNYYFECIDGSWTELQCRRGSTFNENSNLCEPQFNGDNNDGCPVKIKKYHGDNTKYNECSGGYWFVQQCAPGNVFNEFTNLCEYDNNQNSGCPVKFKDNPINQSVYFECNGGVWTEKHCSQGMIFKEHSKTCEWKNSY